MRHVNRTTKASRIPFADLICPAAALLPCFGFFGFLLMARRSGRDRYASFGRIYAGANAILILLYFLFRFTDLVLWRYLYLRYLPSDIISFLFLFGETGRMTTITGISQTALRTLVGYGSVILPLLRTMLYAGCLIHTAVCVPGYCRYLRETVYPYRPERASRRLKRSRRFALSLWMFWCLVPGLGFAAPLFAARLVKDRRMQRLCRVLLCVSAGFLLLSLTEDLSVLTFSQLQIRLFETFRSRHLLSAFAMLLAMVKCCVFFTPLVSFLMSCMLFPDALEASSEAWISDTAAHPSYAALKWRIRNGVWQVLTLLPLIGGLGLIIGGTGAAYKKAGRIGFLHLAVSLLFALAMVILYHFRTRLDLTDLYDPIIIFFGWRYTAGIFDVVRGAGLRLLWWLGILSGCLYRREILIRRADILGGCLSGIDREIRMTRRYLSLGAVSMQEQAVPASEQTRPSTDLNTCSAKDLKSIPGMTPEAAARVLQYREANGGIRSETELIDVLDVKPHRVVRILENAALSAPVTAEPESRRRIDL